MPLLRRFSTSTLILLIGLVTTWVATSRAAFKEEEDLEYDHKILDPYHADGAPYGGFSRATRQRLSKLPLILQESAIDNDDEDRHYTVRDDTGQLFACQLYAEDELDPKSLKDSMFDYPIFRKKENKKALPDENVQAFQDSDSTTTDKATAQSSPRTRVLQQQQQKGTQSLPTPPTLAPTAPKESSGAMTTEPKVSSPTSSGAPLALPLAAEQAITNPSADKTKQSIGSLLQSNLARICGQIHKGYWSYEWCFEGEVTQFHIEYNKKKNTVSVDDSVALGTFQKRIVLDSVEALAPNAWIVEGEDTAEVARVVDVYEDGAACGDDTSQRRKSFVHLQCCSDSAMKKLRSMIHRDGSQIMTDVARVMTVVEEPTCSYNITVCTPLLCGDASKDKVQEEDEAENEVFSLARLLPESLLPKEGETIPEILDRSLSQLRLQTNPSGGWWTYEMNHKKNIKQYHEASGVRQNAAGAKYTTTVRETENILGKYEPESESHVKSETEWKHVVNATAGVICWGEGNGAYYEVEYVGGNVCDDSDVTDHGIVATERATTVRYHCGEIFDFQVREDTTCHYVVDVKVPGLCLHPLFRAKVSKKQIMKCLPVKDDDDAKAV